MIMEDNPHLRISVNEIMKCICPCIAPDLIKECACPTCTDFECTLSALRKCLASRRLEQRLEESCGQECAAWAQAIKDPTSFRDFVTCERSELPGFECASKRGFSCHPYSCCIEASQPGVEVCGKCGIDRFLPKCACFNSESMAKEWTWLKRQTTLEGKNHDQVQNRLRNYTGTLGELLKWVQENYKDYLHHTWRARFLRRQFHIECDTYDGKRDAVLLADFASAMKLGCGFKGTCESDSTCNVVLVLYKIRGKEFCDYVRFWSPAATS